MSINYDKIRLDNIKEYGEGTRHLEFFNLLYPDRTHFVFELLQNAEDAGATKILFKLQQDRLEVMHDGRPFNEDDVRGICGIDLGTKKEDLTQIGKFGIGFKSVYAYTASPQIHSGKEHFQINNYVRPYQIEPKVIGEHWTTLFVFHLNAKEIDSTKACRDIGARLASLNANTLLFLKKINTIAYQLPDLERGFYQRKVKDKGFVKQITVVGKNNVLKQEESWLVFEKPIQIKNNVGPVRIEVAFRVKIDPVNKTYDLDKIERSPLYVYFPTEKETRLGFLIQGPYRTTPSRDNIPRDDSLNIKLINQTAVFVVECLEMLKKMKLLTVNCLLMMPIRTDDFPRDSMFYPVFDAVKNAFINHDLLPTDDNAYTSAGQVKLARGSELRKLLRREQLKALFHSEADISWLPDGITQDRTPDLRNYLIRTLGIDEITPEWFANRVTTSFFEKQTDEWLITFYKYISGRKELWRSGREYGVTTGPLYDKQFIRLQNDTHVSPFNKDGTPRVFLLSDSNMKTSHPVVKYEISNHEEVKQFLNNLGIPNLDIVEELIESLLPKYSDRVPLIEHWQDIEVIKRAWDTDSQGKKRRLKKALQETPFVIAEIPGTGFNKYIKPTKAYFRNAGLIHYFEGNNQVGFVHPEYDEDILAIFKDLGVSEAVRVSKRSKNPKGYIIISNISGQHERGVDGFDPNIEVEGLAHALKSPTRERSEYIWNNIAQQNVNCIFGTVEKSTRQTYTGAKSEKYYSAFGQLLVESNWLPKTDTEFVQPREISLDDLPPSYSKNEQLADKLGMQKDVYKKLADDAGIALEDIIFLKQHPAEFEKWKAGVISRKKVAYPDKLFPEPLQKEETSPTIDNSGQVEQVAKPNSTSTASSSIRKVSEHTTDHTINGRTGSSKNLDRSIPISNKLSSPDRSTTKLPDIERDLQKDSTGSSKVSADSILKSTRQSRLLSYVSPGNRECDLEDVDTESGSRHLRVGETAVNIVIEHEMRNGRKVRPMAHNNPGYDLISESEGGIRYIEVKGLEGAWGERGVLLSNTQFFYAKDNLNRDYWLYVVENVFSQAPQIHKIHNPIEKVDSFAFDGGWSQAAESVGVESSKIRKPLPGDEVLLNGVVVGIVESTTAAGKFSLVIYRAPDGSQHRKQLADIIVRPKEKG